MPQLWGALSKAGRGVKASAAHRPSQASTAWSSSPLPRDMVGSSSREVTAQPRLRGLNQMEPVGNYVPLLELG